MVADWLLNIPDEFPDADTEKVQELIDELDQEGGQGPSTGSG